MSLPATPTSSDWSAFLESVAASFDCTTGTLHRLDPADHQLKLVAHLGVPASLIPIISSIPIGKGIAGAAAERLAPVELCNLQTDTSGVAKPDAKQTQVQGSLAVPLLADGQLYGTLGIGKRVPYDFSEAEKARLLEIGSEIAHRLEAAA